MRAELREAAEPRTEPVQLFIGTKYSGTDYPWTNTAPGRSTHSPGGKAWHAGAPKNLFTTGAPNHNVSPIFQFSFLGLKNKKKGKKKPNLKKTPVL